EPLVEARGEYVQGATWFAQLFALTGMKGASRAFQRRAWQIGATATREDLLTWGYLAAMDALDHFYIEELPWSSMTRYREATDALRTVGEQRFQLSVSALHGKRLHDLGDLTGAEADLRASLAQARRLGDALPLAWLMVYLARLLARTTQ